MSRYHGNDDRCPVCETRYRDFRTGLTYQAVHDQLKDGSDDPRDWKYKRRHTVLGYWHQLKREWWAYHLWQCEQQRLFEEQVPF